MYRSYLTRIALIGGVVSGAIGRRELIPKNASKMRIANGQVSGRLFHWGGLLGQRVCWRCAARQGRV